MDDGEENPIGIFLWLVSSKLEHSAELAVNGVVKGSVPFRRDDRRGREQESCVFVEGVLDFVQDMLGNAAEVVISESIVSRKKARRQGVRVPLGGREGVALRGVNVSAVN